MNLLEIKKTMKAKKPNFLRQQGAYVKGLEKKWRSPKGMHSKLRRKFRGKMKMPSIGYSSPSRIRFYHPSGLIPKLVRNLSDLSDIKKEHGIIIGSTVGKKKRIEIIKKILELKLNILNIKEPLKLLEKTEEEINVKKEKAKKKQEIKKKSQEISEKKELTKEEKEKQEKELKRKILEGKL